MSKNKELMVAIVGAPNVGKSSLFNRIVGRRISVVFDEPRTTRDRVMSKVKWQSDSFWLVDTAGIVDKVIDYDIEPMIEKQIEMVSQEADLILLVVDGQKGVRKSDLDAVRKMKKYFRKLFLVINKVDRKTENDIGWEYARMGIKICYTTSAINGRGIGDLLDGVVAYLKKLGDTTIVDDKDEEILKIGLIGRPNVGKSSLTNTLCGYERMVVCNKPGTTRDIGEVRMKYAGKEILLHDTAGWRKVSKIKELVERFSVLRSIRIMQQVDVVVLVFDGMDGVTRQELALAGMVEEAGKGLVIFVNKWDLIKKNKEEKQDDFLDKLRQKLQHVYWAPVIFGSAKDVENIDKLLKMIITVGENYFSIIPDDSLKMFVKEMSVQNKKFANMKVDKLSQWQNAPMIFEVKTHRRNLGQDGKKFLGNLIRDSYGLNGVPIKIFVKK